MFKMRNDCILHNVLVRRCLLSAFSFIQFHLFYPLQCEFGYMYFIALYLLTSKLRFFFAILLSLSLSLSLLLFCFPFSIRMRAHIHKTERLVGDGTTNDR